jgi:ATP-dependent Clp protease adaptor protein ClpS
MVAFFNNNQQCEEYMSNTDTPTKIEGSLKIEPKLNVPEHLMFKVIFINDEITTMEFIIEVLRNTFDYDDDDAHHMTQRIHEEGAGVVAVYPYELAEQKGIEVTVLARNNGFPLQVKLEAEA